MIAQVIMNNLRFSSHVAFKKLPDGSAVVLNHETFMVVTLNPGAVQFLELAIGRKESEVFDLIEASYSDDKDAASSLTELFLFLRDGGWLDFS